MNDNEDIEPIDINGLMNYVGDEMLHRIQRRTPIKTGYAESRWDKTQTTENLVQITNDAPYIGVLENGSSDQAPNGMVRITMEEVPDIIDEYFRRNK